MNLHGRYVSHQLDYIFPVFPHSPYMRVSIFILHKFRCVALESEVAIGVSVDVGDAVGPKRWHGQLQHAVSVKYCTRAQKDVQSVKRLKNVMTAHKGETRSKLLIIINAKRNLHENLRRPGLIPIALRPFLGELEPCRPSRITRISRFGRRYQGREA